jgi:threonine/homoserine/homoserine lactone efflux protein
MTAEQAYAFLGFAFVAAITPGPSNVMLTATGANAGVVRGLACLFGVCAGMGLLLLTVAFGLGALVLEHPAILGALKWCSAGFLLWLSWKIAAARPGNGASASRPIGFVDAALFQWVNPKSWLVSASAAGTYLQPDAGTALTQSVLLSGLFLTVALPSGFVWLAFGLALKRWLGCAGRLRAFNMAMGILLASSVIFFVW